MAPTPSDDQQTPKPTSTPPTPESWSTGAIVVAAVFGFIFLALLATAIAYYINKRKALAALPAEHRRSSYHPFRTEASDRKGLLANQAPSPEDDKSTMFTRGRSRSSVSLYVPAEVMDRRPSLEQVNLIPLHITPAEEEHEHVDSGTASSGSGVSKGSRISLGLAPIQTGESTMSIPKTRPRSTSATSVRYYSSNSPESGTGPQIPKIVHTPS